MTPYHQDDSRCMAANNARNHDWLSHVEGQLRQTVAAVDRAGLVIVPDDSPDAYALDCEVPLRLDPLASLRRDAPTTEAGRTVWARRSGDSLSLALVSVEDIRAIEDEARASLVAENKALREWVEKRKARDNRAKQKYRAAHIEEHRAAARESMARLRARRAALHREDGA